MIAPRVLATAILVFGLTGCGGSGDTTTTTAPPNDSPSAPQSTSVPPTVTTPATPPSTVPTTTTIATTTTTATTTTAPPTIVDLAPGLFCRDLNAAGYGYSDAIAYWVSEGQPDRMDADHNGIPCETVYSETDILAFWGDPLPTTTTMAGATRYFLPREPWEYPDSVPPGSGTYGSGCRPGTTALPDGMWFGFLGERGPSAIVFDLACIHVPGPDDEGGAAIRNDNPQMRTIAMDPTIPVHFVLGGWVNGVETYERWLHRGCYDPTCPVWLYVNNGAVTAVAEHFLTG